jgi:serpin B
MKKIHTTLFGLFIGITLNAQQTINIADSNNLFAFKLYHEVKKNSKENLFFSPFSISTALAMTYAGAKKETGKQMRNTLHFSLEQNTFHTAYKTYLEKIESDTGKDLIIGIANSLWIANSFELLKSFSETVTTDYKTDAYNVAFTPPAAIEDTRHQINYWVEQKTNNKIKDLIQPLMLDPFTRLVLVNAIYFNGKWKYWFPKDSTRKAAFYKSDGNTPNADMMRKTTQYKYYEDDFLQSIEIPYTGDKVSLVVFLPKDRGGIDDIESKLDYSYYSKIVACFSRIRTQKVILSFPKFKTTLSFELGKALSNMGMPVAFNQHLADFTGMSKDSLYISKVIHKAFIDVSEEGTEAAAATAVVMKMSMSVAPRPIPVFNANHPFIFVIRDEATGAILFMGKIMDPTKD